MKVSFTAKEYTRVLELTQMGLWVAAKATDRYAEVEQKLLAFATPLGCADLVEGDEGDLRPSEKLETGTIAKKIMECSEDVFWRELVERLAERDLRSELGPTKLTDELSAKETQRLEEIEEGYWRDFEAHGTDHLVLLKGGRG